MDITEYLYEVGGAEYAGGTQAEYDGGARRAAAKIVTDTVSKDQVISSLIPDTVSECSLCVERAPGDPCTSAPTIKSIGTVLGVDGTNAEIMSSAKATLKCETEKCVLTKLAPRIGDDVARREIVGRLKVAGPTCSKLLSNVNIDDVMAQWGIHYADFYPYHFNMRNYASYSFVDGRTIHEPDTLATVLFRDLYTGEHNGVKHRCCACVINTDVYQGEGKHWMALFADARGETWTVEFFNSSGNAPAPEFASWLVKTKNAMEDLNPKSNPQIVKASPVQLQMSKSECGVYSLFYIWARLHNVPASYFSNGGIPDQLMFEFRQHLFDDPTRPSVEVFDWDKYCTTTKITWEK